MWRGPIWRRARVGGGRWAVFEYASRPSWWKTFPANFRSGLKWFFGTATRWEHWLGRCLYGLLLVSIVFGFSGYRIAGGFGAAGLPFVMIGVIQLIVGFGVELFPPEMVERQSRPHPTKSASIFTQPGTGKVSGLFCLAVGVAIGTAHMWPANV